MRAESKAFVITVMAGVNGAGKSSVGGAYLQGGGYRFYNPDEASRQARARSPTLTVEEANAFAWQQGKRLLESAIAGSADFSFETTLGGQTMTKLLIEAAGKGAALCVWYAGLASVDLHIRRVAARVAKGGHSIPEGDIRKRWIGSRLNLVKLLPHVTDLHVYDNSEEKDLLRGAAPMPKLVLAVRNRAIHFPGPDDVMETPGWAKPIVAAAFRTFR